MLQALELHPRTQLRPEWLESLVQVPLCYFGGDDSEHLAEVVFEGSEDELGMEDEDDSVSGPEFEPLEVSDEG